MTFNHSSHDGLLNLSELQHIAEGRSRRTVRATFARYLSHSLPALNDCAAGLLARASRLAIILVRSPGSAALAPKAQSRTRQSYVGGHADEHGRIVRCPLRRAFIRVGLFRRHRQIAMGCGSAAWSAGC